MIYVDDNIALDVNLEVNVHFRTPAPNKQIEQTRADYQLEVDRTVNIVKESIEKLIIESIDRAKRKG